MGRALALVVFASVGTGLAGAAGSGPVPAKAERAIVARFPKSARFYLPPAGLPAAYRYERWTAVGGVGSYALDAFRIEFVPRGKTFARELKRNGTWATWVGYRHTRPCSTIYTFNWERKFVRGRQIFFIANPDPRFGTETASICAPGYAADLTFSHMPLSKSAMVQLLATTRVAAR